MKFPGARAPSGSPPNVEYRPFTNYSGPDSFEFVSNDGQELSARATVAIDVVPVNDSPRAFDDTFERPRGASLPDPDRGHPRERHRRRRRPAAHRDPAAVLPGTGRDRRDRRPRHARSGADAGAHPVLRRGSVERAGVRADHDQSRHYAAGARLHRQDVQRTGGRAALGSGHVLGRQRRRGHVLGRGRAGRRDALPFRRTARSRTRRRPASSGRRPSRSGQATARC